MTDSALRLYFENPVGRVLEHPDGYAVVQYHAGKRKLQHLQAFLTHTGRLMQLRNWNKLLGDQRLMSPFTEEESQWIVGYWLSQEQQNGNIYGAVLLPNDVFARLSVNNMMHEAKAAALTYRMFDSETDAVAWLRQQR
ncbi:hypothetical protein [Solirubrum puertoriconensis]|uniref:STAS/SEC14 domain-containing protein n=1 Tax=Solirubrum puertoriconensis TaxID=1751427 RepID=A0A9X0HMA5_SOLP1|nr:hypothetical protein [Solirubrum puertoriconensis]KUG08574.1 hypothetical protein ASU33_10495 [Solirubrum puertoriconensis]